jgi:hypothetical protein
MLNTKVRVPSPAPMFSSTSRIHSSPFGQAGWRSFGQMSVFRSHCAPLLGAADDLVRGALHIFRKHLDRVVPTLRQILRSVSSASPVSESPPCRNDVNDSSSRSSAARITSLTFRLMCVKSAWSGFSHVGHGPRLPQSRDSIEPPMRSPLIASSSAINSGYSAAPEPSNSGIRLSERVFSSIAHTIFG